MILGKIMTAGKGCDLRNGTATGGGFPGEVHTKVVSPLERGDVG